MMSFYDRSRILLTLLVFVANANANLHERDIRSVPQENTTCHSLQCLNLAKFYHENLDINVDPCYNFYNYACSGWTKIFKKPDYEDTWSIGKVMTSRAQFAIGAILEESDPSDTDDVKVAKKLYNICMQRPFLERKKPEVLKVFIKSAGKWPMVFNDSKMLWEEFEWWRVDNYYLGVAGESAIFDFSFECSSSTSMSIILRLMKPRSTFGVIKDLQFNNWSLEEQESYAQFLMLLVKKIGKKHSMCTTKLKRDIMDVISFRKHFQEMVATLKDENYVKMFVKDFQDWYNDETKSKNTAYVDWVEQIRVLRGNDPKDAYYQSTTVINVSKKYFSSLVLLLDNTPPEVIVNHIHLYFIERHLKSTPQLRKLLHSSVNSGDILSGALRRLHKKWEWCIEDNHMWTTLSQLYVKRYFPQKSKVAVQGLVQKTQKVLVEYIINSTWFKNDEKIKDILRITNLKSMIGYPDWYDDPTRQDREIISAYPMLPEAYVTEPDGYFVLNDLSITAAYLQWPIYTPDAPYVINFGSTVNIIGHELHHLFKTKTPPYSTNASIPWWPRSNCFINLYKTFKDTDSKQMNLIDKVDNSVATLNEDIADAMGLKLAFDAFKQKRKHENGTCAVLTGFETFSCEKLFFIAFANTMCGESTRGAQLRYHLTGKHSNQEVRVNGAVSNMKEFADAFGCKSNDRMVSKKTCTVW